ncbi:DMT family transporter [Sediminibacterium ginsengisoli]|uniref:EamA domain-containing membrane protein RarD n=1 Tax=Sediminibacterium ginsengisoli TaxID=413434 RepID=A0A1T4K5V5_9BACT|nr:DMT family transporter [Sediminibacterium ginsengisoli]SJZ37820.1 EamA domain-containing membrane protein RarD [Sediminibacterium ginsengisoli]
MKDKLINWSFFAALSVIWGSSFILMKAGLEVLSPYQVASIRIMSAGVVLLPFAARAFAAVPRNKLLLVITSGLLGSFFPAYLFCIAELKISSSLTGILNALTPLFTIIVGISFFKLKANIWKLAGVLIGFVGLCLLMMASGEVNMGEFSYTALILIATLFYGINVNLVGRHLQGIGSLNIAALAFVFLLIPCLIMLYVTGYFSHAFGERQVWLSTLASFVLGTMGTAVASVLFYMLVKRAGPLFASLVTYGIPFVAIIWGLIYGENINMLQVGSLVVILGGVYLVNKK